ncbi:hypothetical protein H4R33_005310 [Dimargaris cristalligena]|nr:hypothetical protein H4R33_005310 [Dimargaris cristalligena]
MHFAFTARTLVLLVALTYAASPILAETTTGYENPYENSYESNTQVAKPKSHSMRRMKLYNKMTGKNDKKYSGD